VSVRARFKAWWHDVSAKRAFDLVRIGVEGLPQYPPVNVVSLQGWYRRNELVYACIQKIAEAALDPEPVVERWNGSEWEREAGHPLRQLLMRPNPEMDGAQFLQSWLISEQIAGEFYAEIVRGDSGRPTELWPLDPAKMAVVPGSGGRRIAGYEFRDGASKVELKPKDVLVSRLPDPANIYHGLSPLAVALGSVEADSQQTDYVRAFFQNSGIPSGIIKVLGRKLREGEAEAIQERWVNRYGWGGRYSRGPAVFDENAEYEKVGSSLADIESQTLRCQIEARICAVFGVPPLLVGAYVGLLYVNQRGSAKEAQIDFWMNTMSPVFKRLRLFLTWRLLPEWGKERDVRAERIRVNWDMSQVMALQEEIASRSMRAREDFRVGLLTLNRALGVLGYPPEKGGDYFLRRANQIPITPDVVAQQLEAAAGVTEQAISVVLTGSRDPSYVDEDEGEKRASAPRSLKTFDWDGVRCWREPSETERKIGLVDTGREMIAGEAYALSRLLIARGALIDEAIRKLLRLKPRDFHKLTLDWPQASHLALKSELETLFDNGRTLLRRELRRQTQEDEQEKAKASRKLLDEDAARLDRLSEATISRVLNDIQSRAAAAAAHFVLLSPVEFERRVRARLEDSSKAFLEAAATEGANTAIALGRDREMKAARDDDREAYWIYGWVTAFEYGNPCKACRDLETFTLNNDVRERKDLPDCPLPDCAGGYGRCRCTVIMMRAVPRGYPN